MVGNYGNHYFGAVPMDLAAFRSDFSQRQLVHTFYLQHEDTTKGEEDVERRMVLVIDDVFMLLLPGNRGLS